MMVHHAIKQRLKTPRLSLNLSFSSQILLDQEVIISAFFAKGGSGLMIHILLKCLLILILDMLHLRYLRQLKMKSHGMELNKNILFFKLKIDSRRDPMDGQMLDIQDNKDLIIAQPEEMSALEEQLQMLIISVVFSLELPFQEQMLKLCQVNGSTKLDQLLVS